MSEVRRSYFNAAIGWLLLVGGFALQHEWQGASWTLSRAVLPFVLWLLFRLHAPRVLWVLMLGFLVFSAAETVLVDFAWPDKSWWGGFLETYLLLIAYGLFSLWMIRRWIVELAVRKLERQYD